MSKKPIALSSDSELEEAASLFLKRKFTSAPVIDKKGILLGVLTELGLIKALVAHHAFFGNHQRVGDHLELLDKAVFVNETDPIDIVMKMLLHSPTRRLLVINKARKLTGIISPKDILRILHAEVSEAKDAEGYLKDSGDQLQAWITYAKDLQSALDRHKKMLHETPYMMHSVDATGSIIMANKKAHELLKYKPNELIGKSIEQIYHTKHHALARDGLNTLIKSGKPQLVRSVMVSKDGKPVEVEIKSTVLRDSDQNFIGTISVVRELQTTDVLPAISGIVSK